jgi:DNA-binding transcriptional regulator YiaG
VSFSTVIHFVRADLISPVRRARQAYELDEDAKQCSPSSRKFQEERMPKREKAPGWGERCRVVRERLGLSQDEWAAVFGLKHGAAVSLWERTDASPGAFTLQRGMLELERRGVWAVEELYWWLPGGLGNPPPWLHDDALDPFTPPKRPTIVAMPLDVIEGARRELGKAVAAGATEAGSQHAARAWTALDIAFSPEKTSGPKTTVCSPPGSRSVVAA